MQNPNNSCAEDKFSMNFGNFDTEALFNAAHMGGINLGCKRSAQDAGIDGGELDISSEEDIGFEPTKKEGKLHAHSSREGHHHQGSIDPKNVLLPNGKKTKGRVKIKMEFIDNKLRRYTTFSKRKTGIMKKAYELSTLTGTQVMLLVASETGHVYTFATRKLQPMITSEAGKALIQTCLNSPDPPQVVTSSHQLDQRMSATGYEETELTYAVPDQENKDDLTDEYMNGGGSSCSGSDSSSPPTPCLSPAHTPMSPFTSSAFCSTNGIPQAGLPLHLGQGLVLTPSGTPDSKGETESTQLLVPVNCTKTDSSLNMYSSLPTNSDATSVVQLMRTVTLNNSSCYSSTIPVEAVTVNNNCSASLSGGSMMMGGTGGLMFPPGGNIVYNSSSQDGGTPLLLNLPPGLQLSQDHGRKKSSQMVPLSMNLMSAANALTSSFNQSLPTDLSLHIKRENNNGSSS